MGHQYDNNYNNRILSLSAIRQDAKLEKLAYAAGVCKETRNHEK
jgi:hypothetical protein